MAYDWGREVAEYAAMHAERSTCRRFVRLAFRDGCTDSRAPADDASGFKVGCDVAFLSPTVAHIVNAAERGGFVEHKTGIIYFSCNYAVLSQVVVFLYLRWLENACGKDMRVPDFTPLLPDILSIMDLAVYLDLPALVELCVLRVAENFAEVETLDGLPSPLIRKILNSLDPRGLSLAEGILANSDAFALGSVDDRDFAKAWTERALDLVDYNTSRFLEIVGEELGSPAEAVKVARLGSLENLLAASDVRNDSPASFSQILELMAREGRPLRTLSICLERVGSWGLADWVVLSRCLPGVTSVRLESRGNCLPLETVAWILSAFKGSRCSLKIFVKVSEPQGEAIWLSPLSDWCHSESGRGRDPISHREDLTAAIESKSHLPFHVPNPQQPMTFPSAPNGDRGPVIDLILESSTKSGCSEQELALLFEQIQSLTIVPIVTQLHVSRLSLGAFLPTRLVSSSSTSLTQLHLRQVNLGATGVLDLLGQLSFTGTHLISLDLAANIARSDQRAAEAGFAISKWLATATASRLRCLGLSRNYFCSAGALAIAEGCKPPACPSLTEVDCSGLDLGIALPRLVHALLGSNQSRRVALRSLNVSDPSAPPRLLAETLVLLTATSGVGGTGRAQQLGPGHPQQYQQHLTALNLSRAALTPPLLPLLGRAVSSLSSLATLTLQGSFVEGKDSRVDPLAPPLEDAGFASLCAHLDGPLPLRRLDVSFQRLGDASCLRLGEMMCGMLPRLCAVGFRGNCTTEQGMNSLEDLLDRVGGSRRVIVDFRGNPIEQTSTAAATRGRQRVRLRGFGAKVVVVGEWDCHNNNDGWTGQDEAK